MLQGQGHGEKGYNRLKMVYIYLIALGANLTSSKGTPAATLDAALGFLNSEGVVIRAVSSFYHTPAVPAGAGPDYVNAAARVGFHGTAEQLLEVLHGIETEMGRERTQRWGQRTLDLDIIACGDQVLPDLPVYQSWRELPIKEQMACTPDQLILPHPRLQDRAFVLVPLADIAPEWVHPVLGQSVLQMLDALPQADKDAIKPL